MKNIDKERLLTLVGALDSTWRSDVDAFVVDERQAALNSIVGLRNDIAHGGNGSISLRQVTEYWMAVQAIIDHLESILLPPTRPVRR